MDTYWRLILFAPLLLFVGCGTSNNMGPGPHVLHIQQAQNTSSLTPNPTFLYTYQVLNNAASPVNILSLKGTLSVNNDSPNFSQVLWVLVYWQGACPAHDIALTKIAGYLWLDITKNPSQSNSSFPVNLVFPNPLAATGCIGFYYGGGPQFAGNTTMTADLELTYQLASSPNPNTVVNGIGGEYVFGQNWGGQNATPDDTQGFAFPVSMPAGHLLELYGNLSDSTLDGTANFGPPPTGTSWGVVNDFYLLPGGCGNFGTNLNNQGFPNPVALTTLYSWIPQNAVHLTSVPMTFNIPPGGSSIAALQSPVQATFTTPPAVNAGDCMVTIYGRTGNGATDNETQVLALMGP